MIPKEGSRPLGRHDGRREGSQNKDAAFKFIDFMLKAENGKWVVENIMYKVPNKAGMEAIDKAMLDDNIRTWPSRRPSF